MESAVEGNGTTDRTTTIVIVFVAELRSVVQHVKNIAVHCTLCLLAHVKMSEGKNSVRCLQ